jgi:response regulator RpfG family c-di-GMP phosphodiesterase
VKKILFVDDEPNVLAAFQRQLRKQFSVETAPGPNEGLAILQNDQDYAVVVADMRMPEMNGVEFLTKVKALAPEVVRLMLTGNADQGTAIEAINEGCIFRFLNKPCTSEKLAAALEAALRQHQLITAERELLENTLSGSIKVLSEILALTETKSLGHTETLRNDIRALAAYMKIGRVWQLEVAATLAHIGQVTIPPEVVLKARIGHTLVAQEHEMFARIPAVGANLLAQIPRLEEVSRIILYQNKRFNGAGFPNDGIAGHDIPLGARLLKALFDLTQVEAGGVSRGLALEQLRNRQGWYDPDILEAICGCFKLATPVTENAAKPPVPVAFPALRVGHLLVSDIETRNGTMIVAAGNRITPALIHRLRNFSSLSGIKEPIYVEAAV